MNHGRYDPDEFVDVIEKRMCEYHKRQPWDTSFCGCTCSVLYSRRLATEKERAENLKRRQEEERRRDQHMADYDAGKIK